MIHQMALGLICYLPIFHSVSFLFLFIRYFLYLHFKCYPLYWFSPRNSLSNPPSPASMTVFPDPPTHSHLSSLPFPYTGALSLHRTKRHSSHGCPTRPSSATYAAGAMGAADHRLNQELKLQGTRILLWSRKAQIWRVTTNTRMQKWFGIWMY